MSPPILMYHQLTNYKTNNCYALFGDDFEQHLHYIQDQGLSCPTVGELFGSEQWPLVKSSAVITFDDGNASDVELALPLLQKYNYRGTFFITTDWIDRPGYMRREQLQQLQAAGMSIQSHAKSHRFLDVMSKEEVGRELIQSKRKLETILQQRVDFLSCPGGRYNREVLRSAHQIGYRGVFTSTPYFVRRNREILVVGRCVMRYRGGGCAINSIVQPSRMNILLSQAAYLGKFLLKMSMGNRLYHHLWQRLVLTCK